MKKVLLLTVAIVMAFSTASFAAISFTGDVGVNLKYVLDKGEFSHTAYADLYTAVAAGDAATISGGLKLAAITVPEVALGGLTPWTAGPDNAVKVSNAYVKTVGSFFPGLPTAETRLGDLGAVVDSFVGSASGKEGISIEKFAIGPVTLGGFYQFSKDQTGSDPIDPTIPVYTATDYAALGAAVSVAPVTVKAGVVSNRRTGKIEYHAGASATPVEGITVGGDYAADAAGDTYMGAKVTAAVIPNVSITALYRDAANFTPWFPEKDADGYTVAFTTGQKGFKVGVDTTQAGVKLSASYDQNGGGVAKVSAGYTIAGVALSAAASTKNNTAFSKATISASKDVELVGQKFSLAGIFGYDGDAKMYYGADATWTAPNGINFGIHYNDVNQAGVDGEDAGAYITSGISVSF